MTTARVRRQARKRDVSPALLLQSVLAIVLLLAAAAWWLYAQRKPLEATDLRIIASRLASHAAAGLLLAEHSAQDKAFAVFRRGQSELLSDKVEDASKPLRQRAIAEPLRRAAEEERKAARDIHAELQSLSHPEAQQADPAAVAQRLRALSSALNRLAQQLEQ